uniref:NADH-ubiquinone oxidoreductase chain 2 n=1 Tax=Ophiura sarsii TaxID=861515 RepID=A0A5J6BSC8_9ECHI|nr:NADH dehydrogenase subunit 2 [Ophiura sarsii]QEP94709.1 NADH dehydrogenase subunit 2 [Ophiura sarsii]QHT54206.1 NADH dehydrogenase subunit 2 [Ophiura sarsii]QYF07892.1 NADH dehydrogenase subunit 2 [Ophiura sarsii]
MTNLSFFIVTILVSISGCWLASNWIVIWLWVELNSLALIPILSLNTTPRSIEATSKYFLFQAMGSAILLLGILFRTYSTGNLSIVGTYNDFELLLLGFALTMKMGIFPNHFWFIDVMQGLNFMGGFFVAIVSKIIPVYLIIIISNQSSKNILLLIGISSVLIGSIFGVQQTQLRKLIALSSVAHLGWMIIFFTTSGNSWLGAILFISYLVMVMPLFWIGNIFSLEHLTKTINLNTNSALTTTLCLTILSMAGFPPLLGFFYKWLMFFNVTQTNSFFVVSVLIIASLFSLYFYIQICLSFYMTCWPTVKILSNNNFTNVISASTFSWSIVLVNLFLYYIIWVVSPLSSAWNL